MTWGECRQVSGVAERDCLEKKEKEERDVERVGEVRKVEEREWFLG